MALYCPLSDCDEAHHSRNSCPWLLDGNSGGWGGGGMVVHMRAAMATESLELVFRVSSLHLAFVRKHCT